MAAPARAGQAGAAEQPVDDRLLTLSSHDEVARTHGRVRLILDDSYDSVPFPLGPASDLRRGFVSGMYDFYPSEELGGFHLSAGLHYYSRRSSAAEAFRVGRGLLYIPRNRGLVPGSGFRRYTPASTLGYTEHLTRNFSLGIDGGAMVGRALDAQPLRDYRIAARGPFGLNPIAGVVLGLRF